MGHLWSNGCKPRRTSVVRRHSRIAQPTAASLGTIQVTPDERSGADAGCQQCPARITPVAADHFTYGRRFRVTRRPHWGVSGPTQVLRSPVTPNPLAA